MKNLITTLFLLIFLLASCKQNGVESKSTSPPKDLKTVFEKGNGNQTATYDETIAYYKMLAEQFTTITIEEIGLTDSGKPLHLITYSKNTVDWNTANENAIKILVNNGIHAGESDGIDASMMLMRDLATGAVKTPDNLIFSTIAIYNVGGSLNRNSDSRTNQNGPESYGFRGNARNYDLNRDFIKADSRNARAFYEVYHKINPDIFIDNHVSNGADYQYTLTHLFTQHNKLGSATGTYLQNNLQPDLEKALLKRSLPITPYVNVWNGPPESGFSQFMDSPRYSSGYTTLWNTLGLVVETHMLKPYKDRVAGTKAIMEEMIALGTKNMEAIKKARIESFAHFEKSRKYALSYTLDETKADTLQFMGYEPKNDKSALTGNTLLTYDRSKPFTKAVPFYNQYIPGDSITIPEYYVIPSGQWHVIDLLRANRIKMQPLTEDTTYKVGTYRIADYGTVTNPYEGHYIHNSVVLEETVGEVRFRESDILVPTAQPGIRYILETLEPAATDSFFRWNFFDTILQQKEGFSSYVFEATAAKLLAENPAIKKEFEAKKSSNKEFKSDNYAQLEWIHKRSKNYEKAHLTYPIYKIYYEN
ncbi:MAG: M14 family metallopeptidase [Nonlabens sp.]|nr:M14 family metallopeptidase [Nonlabens sp.]